MSTPSSLSMKTKLGFGIGDVGGNLFFSIMGFYLLAYLTDTILLGAALAGTALLIGRIWDAVTDPLMGIISDHTRSRWGRRRPYVFAGSVLLFFSMILMFTDPGIGNPVVLFAVMTLLYCLLNTAYTIVNIPYGALLPELTKDFNERTVLTGYRMSFAVAGTFIGAGAVLPLVNAFGSTRTGWTVMGAVMGAVMMVSGLITFFLVREPLHAPPTGPAFSAKALAGYGSALRSRAFLSVLLAWTFHGTGVTVVQGALIYYFRYIYRDEGMFTLALFSLLTMSLIFIPVWVAVSRRVGKRFCYNLGMAIFAVVVIVFFLFAERGGALFAVALMAAAGVGFSTHYVMPHSILPDVTECDYAESGIRREGIFYGMWTFASKLGSALALALSGWVLSLFGYIPDAVQTPRAILGIRLLCGPVPVFFVVLGIVSLSFYPVTREYYARVLEKISVRERQG